MYGAGLVQLVHASISDLQLHLDTRYRPLVAPAQDEEELRAEASEEDLEVASPQGPMTGLMTITALRLGVFTVRSGIASKSL